MTEHLREHRTLTIPTMQPLEAESAFDAKNALQELLHLYLLLYLPDPSVQVSQASSASLCKEIARRKCRNSAERLNKQRQTHLSILAYLSPEIRRNMWEGVLEHQLFPKGWRTGNI